MKIKKDLKIGAFAGITGFFLVFIFWYLATGYLDWRFAAVIGTGCFGGGFLGSMLRRLYKTGEERKATMIVLIVISFLIIIHIPSLIEQGIGPPWSRWIFTAVLVICWFGLLVEIFKKR